MFYLKAKNYIFSLTFFGLIFFLNSCASDNTNSADAQKAETPKNFFDISGYFDSEINALKAGQFKLKKDAKIDSKSESQIIPNPDWETELKLFKDSDINKIAWVDKYNADKKSNSIIYTTADSTLKIKRIQIDFQSTVTDNFEDIASILIINNSENVLYSSSEFLTYTPKNSISIIRNQQIRSGENKMIEMRGTILK